MNVLQASFGVSSFVRGLSIQFVTLTGQDDSYLVPFLWKTMQNGLIADRASVMQICSRLFFKSRELHSHTVLAFYVENDSVTLYNLSINNASLIDIYYKLIEKT